MRLRSILPSDPAGSHPYQWFGMPRPVLCLLRWRRPPSFVVRSGCLSQPARCTLSIKLGSMMSTSPDHIRRDIIRICRSLYQRRFVVATEGNVSVRVAADRFWITPTGCHKGWLAPDDLLLIDLEGQVHVGCGRPSSEMLMHLALYTCRPDISAVVHAHPPLATALTVAGYTFDSTLLPESVVALGEVPTVPYQMPTTPQFAQCRGGFAGAAWQCYRWRFPADGIQSPGNRRTCCPGVLSGKNLGRCPAATP